MKAHLTAVLALFLCTPFVQQTSMAVQSSMPATQGELLRWFVHWRGEESSLPAPTMISDYIQWALRHKIEPKGGWNADAVLTREDFAQTLAQFLGLDTQNQS